MHAVRIELSLCRILILERRSKGIQPALTNKIAYLFVCKATLKKTLKLQSRWLQIPLMTNGPY